MTARRMSSTSVTSTTDGRPPFARPDRRGKCGTRTVARTAPRACARKSTSGSIVAPLSRDRSGIASSKARRKSKIELNSRTGIARRLRAIRWNPRERNRRPTWSSRDSRTPITMSALLDASRNRRRSDMLDWPSAGAREIQSPRDSRKQVRILAERTVRAPRGTALHRQGWPQEAAFRLTQNNLDPDVADRPDDLIVYGAAGRAARSWPAFDRILAPLARLKGDETLLVQSGKPVGVFRTHEWAPRVLIANALIVPRWATWDEFRRLEDAGLTMYGQMTAGSWIYIGTQGILQGTYETFAAVARTHFDGSLAGRLVVTARLGGLGGAPPIALPANEGGALRGRGRPP